MACNSVVASLSSAEGLLKAVFAKTRPHIETRQISKSGEVRDTIEAVGEFLASAKVDPAPSVRLAEQVDALGARLARALEIAAAPEWLSQVTAGLSQSAVDELARLVRSARAAVAALREAQDECEAAAAAQGPVKEPESAAALRVLLHRWRSSPPDDGEIAAVSAQLLSGAPEAAQLEASESNLPVLQRMCLTFGGQITAVTRDRPPASYETETAKGSADMFYDIDAVMRAERPGSATGGINFSAVRQLNSIRAASPVPGPCAGTVGRSDDGGELYKRVKFPDELGTPEEALARIMRGPSAELLGYNARTNECVAARLPPTAAARQQQGAAPLEQLERELESREHQATGDARLALQYELRLSRLAVAAGVEDSLDIAGVKFSAF